MTDTLMERRAPRSAPARPAPAAARPRRRRRVWTPSSIAVNVVLLIAVVYAVLPLAWLLVAATKTYSELFSTGGFEFATFSLFDNLARLFTYDDGVFGQWLLNSVLYFVVASAASTLICLATGYAFDKFRFRGKEVLFGLVLVGILLPSTVLTLPKYLLFAELDLTNTAWAIVIPALVNPFGVFLARTFSEGYVPDEVLEAARIDGAGEVRMFRSVAAPMMLPGAVTIFLFSFTGGWNNFFLPLVMLSDPSLFPANLGLYIWNSTVQQQPEMYSLVIVGSFVALFPLILAFVLLQRYWRSGITSGALK